MKIEVLTVPDCPNRLDTVTRLREALTIVGVDAEIAELAVADVDQALVAGMAGSPTILIDGRDPFDGGAEPSMSCRLYATPDGLRGSPTVDQLVRVLR